MEERGGGRMKGVKGVSSSDSGEQRLGQLLRPQNNGY